MARRFLLIESHVRLDMLDSTNVAFRIRIDKRLKPYNFDEKFLYPQAACTSIAVIRHFFQTAVFTWMLVEAVNLFIKLVKVISTKTFYMTYLAIGWGK